MTRRGDDLSERVLDFAARIGKGRCEGTPEAVRIGREQGFANNAADVVLAQDRRVEAM